MSTFQSCQLCFFELVYYRERGGRNGGGWVGGSNRMKGQSSALSQSECQLFSVLLTALLLRIGILPGGGGGGGHMEKGGGGGEGGFKWQNRARSSAADTKDRQLIRAAPPGRRRAQYPLLYHNQVFSQLRAVPLYLPPTTTPSLHPPPPPPTTHPPIPQSCTMPACFSTPLQSFIGPDSAVPSRFRPV